MREAILFLGPPILALAVPAALGLAASRRVALGLAGGLLAAGAAACLVGGLPAAVVVLALGLLAASAFLSLRALGAPRAHALGATYLALALLFSTIFWAGRAAEHARARGAPGDTVNRWTARALDLHPYTALGRFAPGSDPLRTGWLYAGSGFADYGPYVPAPWGWTAAAYAILAAAIAALGSAVWAWRRRRGR